MLLNVREAFHLSAIYARAVELSPVLRQGKRSAAFLLSEDLLTILIHAEYPHGQGKFHTSTSKVLNHTVRFPGSSCELHFITGANGSPPY